MNENESPQQQDGTVADKSKPLRPRSGGRRPTRVTFRQDVREFSTSKAAFIWLLECFVTYAPDFFTRCRSPWLLRYVARHPRDLFVFSEKPPEVLDQNAYHRLSNEWFVHVGISLSQKFEFLTEYGCLLGLQFPDDWDFDDITGDTDLVERRTRLRERPAKPEDYVDGLEADALDALRGARALYREKQVLVKGAENSNMEPEHGTGVVRITAGEITEDGECADVLLLLLRLQRWQVTPVEMFGSREYHSWDNDDEETVLRLPFALLVDGDDYLLEYDHDYNEYEEPDERVLAIVGSHLKVGTQLNLLARNEDQSEDQRVFEVKAIQFL